MVITLSGENSFAWQTMLNDLSQKYIKEFGDLALEKIDGEEADYSRIIEGLTALPFLASKKMVVIREASKNKQLSGNIEHILEEIPESTDVVLVEPKLDKRSGFYKVLKKKTELHEFNEMDMNGLSKWLVSKSKSLSGNLSISDARYLVERIGINQQKLSNELDKILLYNPDVSRASIDQMTEATPQSTIFQLLETAFAGNTRKVMELYKEQRALKVEPQQIIAMLAWQLNILSLLKTAGDRTSEQIAQQAKLNPYVVRKSQNIANKLTFSQLKKLISDLLNIDLKSKSTNINSDEALQNYLIKIGYAI